MQSLQDDNYEFLELFAEQVYIFLVLKALQSGLSPDEAWILDHASRVAALVHPENGERTHLRIVARGA